MSEAPIRKVGGIIIKGRRVLVNRGEEKDEPFVSPGGKVDWGETVEQALVRELYEEHGIIVNPDDLEKFDEFEGQAATQPDRTVQIAAFLVNKFSGEPKPQNETKEQKYLTSRVPSWIPVGSIMEHQIMPKLKEKDLID